MIYAAFGSNRQGVIALLLLPSIALGICSYLYAAQLDSALGGPLYDVVIAPLKRLPVAGITLNILAILAGALLVNVIFNRHEFASRENYFPALVYFMFCVSDLSNLYLNPIVFANLFVLFGIRRLLATYRISSPTYMLYDSGLFISLAIFIFPPVIMLLPLIWVGLFRLRSFNLREWLLPVAGFLTPVVYAIAAFWWFGSMPDMLEFFEFDWSFGNDNPNRGSAYTFFVVTAILTTLGIGHFISDMGVSTVHRKNSKAVFIWYAVFTLIVFAYAAGLAVNEYKLHLLFAPAIAIFMGVFFSGARRPWLLQIIMYVWLLLAVLQIWSGAAAEI
jgi:hypothetical protein